MSITHSGVQVRTLDIVQDGDTFYKTNYDEKTGAARAYAGFDANSTIITSVLPGTNVSVQSGLNLTQTYLGYYNGAEWMSYMNIEGEFYLGGTDGSLQWNGTTLLIGGDSQLIFGTRIIPGANILSPDVRLWHETTVPSGIGYWTEGSNPYGYDPYGSGEENNSIISTLNPFGHQDLVWECNVVSGGEEAGGWAYNTYDIDKTLRYRHTIWAKFIGGIGRDMFFGPGNTGHTSDLTFDDSDSVNNDPYFASGLELPNAINYYDNAVYDGDFELVGSGYQDWSVFGSPTTSERSTFDPHTGTYHWDIGVLLTDDPLSGVKSGEFTLEGYTQYRFSVWVKGQVSLTNKWQIYIDNGEERHWLKQFEFENNTLEWLQWREQVVHFRTGERSTTNRVYIISAGDTDTTGSLFIDECVISNQLIINPGCEAAGDGFSFHTGWQHVGTPTYNTRDGVSHGSGYSRKVTVDDIGEGVRTSKLIVASGRTTSTVSSGLEFATGLFTTNGTKIGDKVWNLTPLDWPIHSGTEVTGIDSDTQLSVNDDIFVEDDYFTVNTAASYIKLMGGYQYRCSIWLYGEGLTEWNAKVSDGTNDYDFLETDNTTTLVPGESWINYVLDFEAVANSEDAYIEITSVGISGSLYIDDVSLQETPWYLLTGFVHPDDYAGTESWGDLYHYKIGYSSPAYSGIDYKSLDATAVQGFRCFQTNSDNNEENKLLLYSPAVHVVDGSEPSLSTLLGNSINMAWNVEHATSISRYLLSSPTIRGGNYAGGNYVQMDAYGIRAFGAGVQTVQIDSIDGSGYLAGGDFVWDASGNTTFNGDITSTATITGGTFRTAGTGKRIEIEGGTENTLIFYDSSNNATITMDEDIILGLAGILTTDAIIYMTDTDPEVNNAAMAAGLFGIGNFKYYSPCTIIYEWDGIGSNATNYPAFKVTFDEITTVDFTGDRIGIESLVDVTYASTNLNSIGIYGYAANTGGGLAIGGRFRSTDIGVRMEYDATHYADFEVNTIGDDSYLTITPNSADGGSISMRGALGSSMFLIQFDDDTVYAGTTLSNLPGMRIHNASTTTDSQCGIHFSSPSAYAGIYGINGPSTNQQGIGFYTEDDTRSIKMELTHDGNLIHKDILYPEIATGGSASARTWTIDVMDMSGSVTSRIGDNDGIGGESTRGVVEWWVSWSEFGAPESIAGDADITFAVTTGTAHGSVSETARNVATTNSSGRVVITATTANSFTATNVWLHVRIGAGICYSEEATVYNTI